MPVTSPKPLNEWLRYLESLHPFEIELGLSRVSSVYETLGLSEMLPSVITVAGTNGKGSTVAMIEQIAMVHGQSVGAYTSPHLFQYNERVRLNGVVVADALLVDAFERIEEVRGGVSLTYFEFGTLAAVLIFAEAGLDLVVLEVGLGGRLDAVNMVDSDVAIVTSVDIDHIDWLGSDREVIGFEKAGVARPEKPFICGDPDTPASVVEYADEIGSIGYFIGKEFGVLGGDSSVFEGYYYQSKSGKALRIRQTRLPGLHQNNVSCALQASALTIPGFDPQKAEGAAANTVVQGRQQWIPPELCNGKRIVVDVGHNPHAATSLRALLVEQSQFGDVYCLMAIMEDKDIGGVIDILSPAVNHWMISGLPEVDRAALVSTIEREFVEKGVALDGCFEKPSDALTSFVENTSVKNTDLLVVFGSFFTAAAALDYFNLTL